MELDRAQIVDAAFKQRVAQGEFPTAKSVVDKSVLSLDEIKQLFKAQCISRLLDLHARRLRSTNRSFYTIGSSGHEGNAAIAAAFSVRDPAFLHYRSGGFMATRSMQANIPVSDYIEQQCLSFVASSKDPTSGGRHKVFGSKALNVPPQTSTIASHAPKAFGSAFALMLARAFKHEDFFEYDEHAVVLCSFGDASFNHSTLQGAINASQWLSYQHTPLPIVWICEDNGIGISVPTPQNWIQSNVASRHGLVYIHADGLNLTDVYAKAKLAENIARIERKPAFLHVDTVRLMGHAGSDVEFHYHTENQITQTEAQDPLLHTARILHQDYQLTLVDILNIYHEIDHQVAQACQKALQQPRLGSASEIMQSIVPNISNKQCKIQSALKPSQNPLTMAQSLNFAMQEVLSSIPQAVFFGEDVGKKGGVYWVTQGLQKKFGQKRVFDTLLDEQSILGTAIGLGQSGFLPIPEIQFLAYVHNAEDQIRGEAATLSFFSNRQFVNPMVIRIPSFAYQKGFGGHFHNDNAFGFLREIPGILIATPSTPADAAHLFKQCVKRALEENRVVIFMEPIALYHQKDLYQDGDNQFLQPYTSKESVSTQQGGDITIISYANGMRLSRVAAQILKQKHHVQVNLFDLKWLKPLPEQALLDFVKNQKAVIIVDECRQTGSISEQITTLLVEKLNTLPIIKRITAQDSFVPLGTAWEYILPSVDDIVTEVNRVHTESFVKSND